MEAKDTKIIIGLTIEEVEERKRKNLVNYDTSVPTKSIKRILLENFFTLFNFLILKDTFTYSLFITILHSTKYNFAMIVPNMQHILKYNIKFSLNLGVYYVKFQVFAYIIIEDKRREFYVLLRI